MTKSGFSETAEEFAEAFKHEYGDDPEKKAEFLSHFSSPDEKISIARALQVVDEILLGDGKPVFPATGGMICAAT